MSDGFVVLDDQAKEIKVGARVSTWWPQSPVPKNHCVGTVTEITDPDADYDDDLERGVFIAPKVYVRFDVGGDTEYFSTSHDPGNYEDFICEELTIVD